MLEGLYIVLVNSLNETDPMILKTKNLPITLINSLKEIDSHQCQQ